MTMYSLDFLLNLKPGDEIKLDYKDLFSIDLDQGETNCIVISNDCSEFISGKASFPSIFVYDLKSGKSYKQIFCKKKKTNKYYCTILYLHNNTN